MKFYTSVQKLGDNLLYRWAEDGKRYSKKVAYKPTYYVPSNVPTGLVSFDGKDVAPTNPGGLRDCWAYIQQYKDVEGFKIYGNIAAEFQFIGDEYKKEIEFDITTIRTATLDIEVGSENGFAQPIDPTEEVTAITVGVDGMFHTWACGAYVSNDPTVHYRNCLNERDLLKKFLEFWESDYPDVVTGWNVEFYDIPYLHNRIKRVLGEEFSKRLSPWGWIKEKLVKTGSFGRTQQSFQIYGVAILDYIALFKKFAPRGKSQESYKLDDIAHVVVKERKLEYTGTLHKLYVEDFQKFIDYNIQDVRLVQKMDTKLQLLMLAYVLAYGSRVNFEDVFYQTRMWDARIYNHLRAKNIMIPPRKEKRHDIIVGAYVKDPDPGMFHWLVSLDFTSLYPYLMILLVISPDNYLGMSDTNYSMEDLIAEKCDLTNLKDQGIAMGANGALFKKDEGFLPEILKGMIAQRKYYKKLMLKAKSELETCTGSADEKKAIEQRIAMYDAYQSSFKVSLNSCYGTTSNAGFRYYNANLGEAVTLTGQLAIQWVIKRFNQHLNEIMCTVDHDYVIAADTDSMYVHLGPLVDKMFTRELQTSNPHKVTRVINQICETDFQPFIAKACEDLAQYLNGNPGSLDMKRESIADRGIWTGKKRYALNVYDKEGVTYPEPKIEITGFEIVRSSTPRIVRDKLKEALKIIMTGENAQALDYIDKFRAEFMKLPLNDIAFPRGVYNLEDYAHPHTIYKPKTPMHTKGSLVYNHNLQQYGLEKKYPLIRSSEKIKFIYLRDPNPLGVGVVAYLDKIPPEFELDDYIDRNMQFEKAFLDPLKRILVAIGWDFERRNTLF